MNPRNYPLWTALITPMNENGEIDYFSLEKIIRIQERANIGVLLLGSTGEALNLNYNERIEILNFVITMNLQVPLMVGIPGINLDETLKWIDHLEGIPGIHAYLMVTPLYAKPGAHGQYLWFKSLLDQATRPSMLYNIPSRSGIELNFNAYQELKDHPNFWALKEASGKISNVKKYLELAPNIDLFSGDDGMMPEYARAGAKGLISVASNVWPLETKKYVELSLANTLKEETLWQTSSDSLFITSNPVPIKSIMFDLKLINSKNLRAPLSALDLDNNQSIHQAHKNITSWYKDNT